MTLEPRAARKWKALAIHARRIITKTVRGGTMIVQVERYVNEVLSSYEHGRERIGVLVGRVRMI